MSDLDEIVNDRPAWWSWGACNGLPLDLFFPQQGEDVTGAKRVCAGCVVRQQCLEYALANGERWGIWGGLSENERRAIRRRRKRAAA